MAKPIMNEADWVALFVAGGWPDLYVDVQNLRARILCERSGKCFDITAEIPDGQKLAIEAVEAFGGSLSRSGMYPPSEEIIEAAQRLMKKVKHD
jgi:hypothetical protein